MHQMYVFTLSYGSRPYKIHVIPPLFRMIGKLFINSCIQGVVFWSTLLTKWVLDCNSVRIIPIPKVSSQEAQTQVRVQTKVQYGDMPYVQHGHDTLNEASMIPRFLVMC